MGGKGLKCKYLCGTIAKSHPAAGTTDNYGMLRLIYLSGSACSVCGSMARRVIAQPHFLHFTTEDCGRAENMLFVTPIIIANKRRMNPIVVVAACFWEVLALACLSNI
jgi:hypothetical protein